MSPEAQRIAIAEACGWVFRQYEGGAGTIHFGWFDPTGKLRHWSNQTGIKDCPECLPDYLNSLDAMHEAEMLTLRSISAVERYRIELRNVLAEKFAVESDFTSCAPHRLEALLRTLNR